MYLTYNARIAEMEALFADLEHYKDGYKVAATNREYIRAKESIRSLSMEQEKLNVEIERMTREYEELKDKL